MVIVWIGIAAGILISIILIVKIIKTPFHESIALSAHCKKCGYKTNGLKCPRCDKHQSYPDKYK